VPFQRHSAQFNDFRSHVRETKIRSRELLTRLFSTGACRNFGTILEKKVSLAAPQNLERNMNARKEIRDHLIAARMKR
jgi:hypothetical protein